MHETNVTTLSKILAKVRAGDNVHVDHLSIDVEGEDIMVIRGSQELFEDRRVAFVEFEVNSKGVDSTGRLVWAADRRLQCLGVRLLPPN